ncbi:hypothetical protein TI04_10825 [Achromatium sp. WMS2]|nr:hypothetical protein TI04_10825 [Achromatium sp. WMS2]
MVIIYKFNKILTNLIVVILGMFVTAESAFAEFYRWVDDDGHVQFSDTVPANAINREQEVIGPNGSTVEIIARPKTREELLREQREQQLRAENQKLLEKQRAADQVLLRTFRNEDDILMARNGKVDAISSQIKFSQSNLRRYQNRLDALEREAANRERKKQSILATQTAEMQKILKNISDTHLSILKKEQEKQVIIKDFDRDLRRFRVLKNKADARNMLSDVKITVLDNLIPCGVGPVCDETWRRAEAFLLKHSTTSIQIQTNLIIMAKFKNFDLSICMFFYYNKRCA